MFRRAANKALLELNAGYDKTIGIMVGDGGTDRHPISQYDDGYSRIMDKLEQIH